MLGNLRRLTQFKGRESRGSFWPYAALVILPSMIVVVSFTVPAMAKFWAEVDAYAVEHPEDVTVRSGPGYYEMSVDGPTGVVPDVGLLFTGVGAGFLTGIVLLGAAVSRRLHDSGLSGFVGLLPTPFMLFGVIVGSRLFASFGAEEVDLSLFMLMFTNNVFYIVCLFLLAALLVRPSTAGPNRYGEAP
ncbi:DUF805 domain-containing protein [Caulobacter segnis]|uniref:DUF805 domain-containing protein n=1 Tax=Caulobacter segnis TaxID=88688 RepID=UPI002410AFD1|nr:DUF805 domain-containing protein [Caulobacter segnis]